MEKNEKEARDKEVRTLKELVEWPESKFVKVKCPSCGNEQIIFNKASTTVRCLVCNEILAKPTGGKAKILAEVVQVLE